MKNLLFRYSFLFLLIIPFCSRAIPYLEFKKGGVVLLDKEGWLFYYGHNYQEVAENNTLQGIPIKVPGDWNAIGFPEKGFGTYRFRFTHNLKAGDFLSLELFSVGTNFDLFVNGEKIYGAGNFSENEALAKPDFHPGIATFQIKQDTVELALQVSNYHYRQGGIWYTPLIGFPDSIDNNRTFHVFIDAFLCGSMLVMFCYFLSFYFIKKDDKTSLMFSLLCLFGALRIASTGNILFRQFDIGIPWEVFVRIEFLSLAMLLYFGIWYIRFLFPEDGNKFVLTWFSRFELLTGIFFLLVPVKYSSYIIPWYIITCAILLALLLNLILKVIYAKRPYSFTAGGVFLLVFIAAINDILHSQAYIKSVFLLPGAIFVFVFVQGLTISRKFSEAFKEVEDLSDKLIEINKNQKEIIFERTSMLNEQAQELQLSNRIKDKVFSIIAHDLRSPIKSLSTVLSWVAEDELTFNELKKSLSSISKNVETLNLTMENLLQWSRNQLNGIRSEPVLIDIRKPLQEMIDFFKIQLTEKEIEFKIDIQERFAVYIDPYHLDLILRNLISNAIKFSRQGGLIAISARTDNNNHTVICVKDNGVGMSKEVISKVFSTVEHFTTYGTNNEKGTGLGLLLCKEYVENGNGSIWIESVENKETKVCFSLPNFSD